MYRNLVCLAVAAVLAAPCHAEDAANPNETLVRLTVSPARAPTPALKYVLLPELSEMNPGNAVHGYLVCFGEQQKFFYDKEALDRRDELLSMPFDKLPLDELRDYGGSALKQADLAARLDQADWQVLLKLRAEGAELLIPDVQQMRLLARALKVRFRGEVAAGRFDAALRTAQTMFAMSRHLGQHITIVGNLVGVAIAHLAMDPLEEMVAQPDCPNLYWALAYLPNPLVARDNGAQGERVWIGATFRELDDRAPLNDQQLDDLITRLGEASGEAKALREWLDARINDRSALTTARKRLVKIGVPVERLALFSAKQVFLMDEKLALEERIDDLVKLVQLPAWQTSALAAEVESRGKLVFDLAPGMATARWAHARLEQRLALLRHVEALRLYAAQHGALPAKLSDVGVPLPNDPLCGQRFRYELNGDVAHLRGTPPKAEEDNPAFNWHYQVTLRE